MFGIEQRCSKAKLTISAFLRRSIWRVGATLRVPAQSNTEPRPQGSVSLHRLVAWNQEAP